MDKTYTSGRLADAANTIGFLVAWIAIVLAWRSFVGSDGGVLWLVHRLFG